MREYAIKSISLCQKYGFYEESGKEQNFIDKIILKEPVTDELHLSSFIEDNFIVIQGSIKGTIRMTEQGARWVEEILQKKYRLKPVADSL